MKKDDERNLHFVSCLPKAQAALRETRRVVWETQMSFNAVDILIDEETRQPTDASREIYPMRRVDTDKNAHLRGDNDFACVPAKYKGRLAGYGDVETTEGLRADPLAGNVDSNNIVCSWCAQAHVSIHSCDFTNGYSQGQEIDRILLYRIPKEGVTRGAILVSRLPIHGAMGARAEVMDSVLQNSWLPKKNIKRKTTLNENNR